MFVIPINDSILYVEPVYLESSTDTSLPEVKRVIVAYGDRIAYEPTLAEALIKLFSLDENYTPNGTPPETQEGDGQSEPDQGDSPSSDTPLSLTELAGLASEAYDNAVAAQREGDWATYGKYLERAQRLSGPDGRIDTVFRINHGADSAESAPAALFRK